jgi:uncharacterized protein YjbI with pentapeptide repeats
MNIYTTNNYLIREGNEKTMSEALRNAIDSGISLRDAKLSYSYFIDFDFSRSDLSGANFNHSNMSGSKFSNSYLCDTSFYRAILKLVQIDNTDLSRSDLREANLHYAVFRRAKLISANLSGADLSYADLSGADLSEANLRGANLSGANLSGANFENSTGLYIPGVARSMELRYTIVLVEGTLFIGCRYHKLHEWFAFDDKTIHKMDSVSLKWWRENRDMLYAWSNAKDFGIKL